MEEPRCKHCGAEEELYIVFRRPDGRILCDSNLELNQFEGFYECRDIDECMYNLLHNHQEFMNASEFEKNLEKNFIYSENIPLRKNAQDWIDATDIPINKKEKQLNLEDGMYIYEYGDNVIIADSNLYTVLELRKNGQDGEPGEDFGFVRP